MSFISTRTWQYTYFAMQLNDCNWGQKNILDFGGNVGNMLRDPNSTIDEQRYWCIDVVEEAIEKGKAAYPKAHFHFYNRYCYFFNPTGVRGLRLPPVEERFDYILAYSVFTNASRADMLDLVEQLKGMLKEGAKLAFTFIDPHFHSFPEQNLGTNFERRLNAIKKEKPDLDIVVLADAAREATWCILVDDCDLYLESDDIKSRRLDQQKSHFVFYTEEYMRTLYPEATILAPVNNEGQHCCVLKSSTKG
jgi:Methyltransferase domain